MEKESLVIEGASQMHEEPLTFFLDNGDANEKCGICCSPVTSRGVLDCCSHIFCYTCIEIWSAITNLCPTCKLQFKFITFIPCADHEDSTEVDAQGDFVDFFEKERDQCWNGGNEEDVSLSFPSYFIDEDAVVCLDGDGCRVRAGGLATEDGESGLEDTSVACDSCDCWYHAICVGYKPEPQKSWLCPRCSNTGILDFGFHSNFQENSSSSAKSFSPGKTSNENVLVDCSGALTVVESGETAVVVAMDAAEAILKDYGSTPSLPESLHLPEDITELCELDMNKCISVSKVGSPSPSSFPLQQPSEEVCVEQASVTDVIQNISTLKEDICTELDQEKADGKLETMLSLACSSHLSLSTSTSTSGGLATSNSPIDAKVESPSHPDYTSQQLPKIASDEPAPCSKQEAVDANAVLDMFDMKQHKMATDFEHGGAVENHEGSKAIVEDKVCLRKDGQSEDLHGKHMKNARQKLDSKQREVSRTRDSQPPSKTAQDNLPRRTPSRSVNLQGRVAGEQQAEEELVQPVVNSPMQNDFWDADSDRVVMREDKAGTLDELSELVQGHEQETHRNAHSKFATANKGSTGTNDGARTRRIVHRGNDLDEKTSVIVKQVQLRLKEAASPGVSSKLGKADLTDERLFAALKAAVVDSQVGMRRPLAPFQRTSAFNKAQLNKDGVRQNLTRKLYGNSGKRRQAWDRDWDIAFWKERASKDKKARYQPKNVDENLELDFAQMEKVIYNSDETSKAEANSILNRIYLADTSLLPRQTDIEPLAMQLISKKNSMPVQLTENEGHVKTEKGVTEKLKIATAGKKLTSGKKDYHKPSPVPAATSKTLDPLGSNACVPSPDSQQDLKTDKRKWALQVLARKTGQVADNSAFKGKKSAQERLPLLVELPVHMRPVVEYDRRSKVPTSIRQVHLDRFVEYYLQKANVESLNENTECKAAILAAENREKEIYDRANSKGVYVNLCVQAHLSSNLENDVGTKTEVITPQAAGTSQIEIPEVAQNEESAVERAFKAAGLVSDSPSGSPCQEDSENRSPDDGSIFDLENDPSLDIYRDLEFDLDDIGTGEIASNKEILPSIESSHCDPKTSGVKVVLTTLVQDNPSKLPAPNNTLICKELDGTERKSALSEVVTTVDNAQILDGTENEKIAGTTLVCRQEEAQVKKGRDSGESLGPLVGIDEKDASESERLGLLESNNGHNEITVDSIKKWGDVDSNAGSGIPDRPPLVLDLPEEKIREGLEQYGSMLAHLAPKEEAVQQEAPHIEPQISAMDRNLQEEPSSNSMRVAGKGLFDEAPELNAKLEEISKQVERFVKEHIRPLHKSHVITTEQYRWAVAKTASKVMQHHTQAKSADFLIPEGDKVKRLAEQYLQAFQKHKLHVKK